MTVRSTTANTDADADSGADAPATTWWRRASGWLDNLPSQCLVCQRWPSRWICTDCARSCWQPDHRRCPRCALALPASSDVCAACLRDPPILRQCHAAVDYSPPWDRLVQQLKFHQHLAWASRMAQLLLQSPGVAHSLAQADVVLPVPLSAARLRERGYNQAALLAQALLCHSPTPAPLQSTWLLRLLDTPAQAQLGRAARLRNLRHAFALEPACIAQITNRQVLLVDDVMTTGATLSAVSNLLLAHGASAEDAIVFARTPAPA